MSTSSLSRRAMVERRREVLGTPYRLFYSDPVELLRGEGIWVWDREGNRYLDAYNNVPCVGHCHPRVVDALSRQASLLNTHTRYLSTLILEYAERLLATLPEELGRVIFTCTGSEANDLASRLARYRTGHSGFIVTSNAYHGTTTATVAFSPSLQDPTGRPDNVQLVEAPNPTSGRSESEEAAAFGERVGAAVEALSARSVRPAALIVDPIMSSDGIIPEPAGFLKCAVKVVRESGGLFIADEVQAGFGRTGHMWGFNRHGVIPDIVTMGKPMGNGYPVAGVAAHPDLVDPFGQRTRYFNTFAGSHVACAVGMTVLDVLEDEQLIENARTIGARLLERIGRLGDHPDIVDVRGAGLFIGVQVRSDGGGSDKSSAMSAQTLVDRLRHNEVLVAATGHSSDVVKIRPPLVFSEENVEHLASALEKALDWPLGH